MAAPEQMKGKISKVLMHPNSLTMFRVMAVPLLIILLLFDNRITAALAAFVFSVAAITDYLDGYIARRYGLVSNLGKILDPLADKMLVSTAFIMLIPLERVPAWIVCVIIGRELAITGFRNIISEHGDDASASMLGKYKTGFQIAAIIPLLIHFTYFRLDFHMIGTLLLWIALVFTVWSGVDYIVRFRKYIEY
ncbi:MAG: CDP-diacylglycerol--glycerol-3-phosphate 3-phosphatidyltransferase [Desulfosalsimonadaceae bacterium]